MAAEIKIKNLSSFITQASAQVSKQARYAAMNALNTTAFGARNAVVEELKRKLHMPTPYILKSAVYGKATKNKLIATVALVDPKEFTYDISGGALVPRGNQIGGPPPPALVPQIKGGSRDVKPFEKMIFDLLGLPHSTRIVPGKGAWLDRYGNISQGEIVKILSDLRAHSERGFTMNRRDKSRGYYRNFRYFVMRRGGRPIGIFAREFRSQSVQPVMMFARGASYRQRIDFSSVVVSHVKKHFMSNFQKAWAQAIRTAR